MPDRSIVPATVTLASVVVPVNVGDADRTTEPLPVEVVTPVPPLATASVPPRVNVPAPVIGPPETVRPVVPPDTSTDVTEPVPVTVAHVGVAPGPAEVKTCPAVPALLFRVTGEDAPDSANVPATVTLEVDNVPVSVGDADNTTEPVPVAVVTPVPPCATARIPPTVNVPAPVTGPPEKVSPVVPPSAATEVTVPTAPHVGVAPGPADSKA